jgi:hypothetical protein
MSNSFRIVLAKLRIGQMNNPISLIINSPNRTTKDRPRYSVKWEALVSMARKWDAVKGRFGFDYRRRRKGAGL